MCVCVYACAYVCVCVVDLFQRQPKFTNSFYGSGAKPVTGFFVNLFLLSWLLLVLPSHRLPHLQPLLLLIFLPPLPQSLLQLC